jgi:hypothetical protein
VERIQCLLLGAGRSADRGVVNGHDSKELMEAIEEKDMLHTDSHASRL